MYYCGVVDQKNAALGESCCHRCGGSYKNFREMRADDKKLIGSTISGILNRNEDL